MREAISHLFSNLKQKDRFKVLHYIVDISSQEMSLMNAALTVSRKVVKPIRDFFARISMALMNLVLYARNAYSIQNVLKLNLLEGVMLYNITEKFYV